MGNSESSLRIKSASQCWEPFPRNPSGPAVTSAAHTGRIHDRSKTVRQSRQILLANRGPSIQTIVCVTFRRTLLSHWRAKISRLPRRASKAEQRIFEAVGTLPVDMTKSLFDADGGDACRSGAGSGRCTVRASIGSSIEVADAAPIDLFGKHHCAFRPIATARRVSENTYV